MATNARSPPTNGVIAAPTNGAPVVNRKKQKRRAKQAAKAAVTPADSRPAQGRSAELAYDEDPLRYDDEDEEDYDDYSDADANGSYEDHFTHPRVANPAYNMPAPSMNGKTAASRKGKRPRVSPHHSAYNADMLGTAMPPMPMNHSQQPGTSAATLRSMHRSVANHPNIWNTSTQQERQNIKNFWLSLSEDERKSLLKIEKEAVLRKMKQQQKHSCSCTVCGRKRTAIEEELEVLYEGYYEELEQYAHHDNPPLPVTDDMLPEPLQHRRPPHPLAAPPPNSQHRSSQMLEHLDEEEEEYSDEEYSEEGEYSDEDIDPPRGPVPDFFNFGQNLTVKGILTPWLEKLQMGLKGKADNLLTVADDLLKNDGRKFIEMMEQLAERRMQRESEAEYAAANPSHPGAYPPNDPAYNHEDPLAAGDEFDDEEGSYDSQDEYDDDLEEEDEMGGLTEEQRMQEGRRMFQIFAARMFEQRVLTAYKEKVAAERQQKLLEELQDEEKLEAQREAKKKRDAEKKKDKKKQQQQAKAEEKAKKDAEKAAEEARLKEAELKKQEDLKRKKEEQRKKKEEEKRKLDEERAKKEGERQRRLVEEQQRKEESEKKAREQRAAEKAKKDEGRKREREEREAREKEAKDRKAAEDREKKEHEAKAKAERAARQPQPQHSTTMKTPQIAKRPSQAGLVAVPGIYPKQTPSSVSSPYPTVATPAVTNASTPAKPRQTSQQNSHASSPKSAHTQLSSVPSKSSSPGSAAPSQGPAPSVKQQPPQKPDLQQQNPQQTQQNHAPPNQYPIQPPPGMSHPQHHPGGFNNMPPMGFHGFPNQHGPMMHQMGPRGQMPMYGHQGPPMGVPNRMAGFGAPGMNGMNGVNGMHGMNGMNGMNGMHPPGMMQPQGRGMNFPYEGPGVNAPPGFVPQAPPQHSSQTSPIGQSRPHDTPSSDGVRQSHSRQQSASDKDRFEPSASQPITRPAPIQRPSSVKPPNDHDGRSSNPDMDNLAKHLGSSALLDDSDEPMEPRSDARRMSAAPNSSRSGPMNISSFGPPSSTFGAPGSSWSTPSLPFGPALSQQNTWGALPSASNTWSANNAAFAANSGFGAPHPGRAPGLGSQPRPLTIRLAICQACKILSSSPLSDRMEYHDIPSLLRQIEHQRPNLDSPPTMAELEAICETEGDAQNGGGELSVRRDGNGGLDGVRWVPGGATPEIGLGEIGSPMPQKAGMAGGFGAPGGRPGGFAGLGAVGGFGRDF
ncbi:hypothetical protein B0A48_03944 [Cryoendolithus antarcticus]|uniref:Stress response protein NST1 n=1 Tax=Cryoendolithus antarcticus TaxID=1507870 RepID=A0A1V8TH07_9PEZI|nr:hypothetical protein B0A48_03944 [Cryoendolithus antarcticus]